MWLLPVLCLLFRFVLQGLIIKSSFLDILSVLWEGIGLSLVSGAAAAHPLFGQGVELQRHVHATAHHSAATSLAPALGTLGKQAQLFLPRVYFC